MKKVTKHTVELRKFEKDIGMWSYRDKEMINSGTRDRDIQILHIELLNFNMRNVQALYQYVRNNEKCKWFFFKYIHT